MPRLRPGRLGRLIRPVAIAGSSVALVAGVGAATAYFARAPETAVLTAVVHRGAIEQDVLAAGILQPARMLSVGAQVSGQIKILHVRLGQSVKAGDLIAEIDDTAQRNALRIAEASLANVEAQRRARHAQLQQADLVYQRQQDLLVQKATSQADLEAAQAGFLALQAEVAALDAQIAQASVELENAKANLGYTRIVAPIDGTVISVVTKQGQTLNSSQSAPVIVVLAQLATMAVKVQISEADISRVATGQKVWFTVLGDRQTRHEAALSEIEPAPASVVSDAQSASNPVGTAVYYNGIFEVSNADNRLRPMMTAQVHIVLAAAQNVSLVPVEALGARESDGRYHVQVHTTDGTSEDRLVEIGLTDGTMAQVLDGLADGEQIVVARGQDAAPVDEAAFG